MAAKQRSRHQKELYTQYKSQNRFATNRKRKLLKLLKEQPNNAQIPVALENIKYRRKTPGTPHFSKTKIATLAVMALAKKGAGKDQPEVPRPNIKHMFSLATRAHTQNGEHPWSSS